MHAGIGHNQPARAVSEVKDAIRWNRKASQDSYPSDPHRYRVDRLRSDYMALQPRWQRKVVAYLSELRAVGERVVYADICGRTTAVHLGADISYCFSLHTTTMNRLGHPPDDVFVDGDFFSMRDFYSFLALMRDKGDRPAYVTFYPIAGLESYTPSESNGRLHPRVTWQRVENNLCRLLEVVRPGGYVYLDRPFQFADPDLSAWFQRLEYRDYPSVKWLQNFCKERKCSVEYDRDITGTKFLLRKWRNST